MFISSAFRVFGFAGLLALGLRASPRCSEQNPELGLLQRNKGASKKEIDPIFWTCKKKLKMKFLYLPPLNFFFKPGVMF